MSILPKGSFYGILLIAIVLNGCKKSEPYKVTPCTTVHPLSAAFSIEEFFQNSNTAWQFYASDTVSVSILRFTALDSLAYTYEWHIGTGIYNGRSFTLEFPAHFLSQKEQIPVTLIVKDKAPRSCSLQHDTIQTFTKNIYFTDQTLVTGKFKGHVETNPADTFTVTINPSKPCSELPNGVITTTNLLLSNLVRNCETLIGGCQGGRYKTGYKEILFTAESCFSPGGIIKIGPDNNSVVIEYSFYKNGYQQQPVQQKFIGTRIN